MEKLAEYRKAIASVIAPGIIVAIAFLNENSDGGTTVTLPEWLQIALAILGTGTIVAAVPNALTTKQQEQVWVKAKDMIALGELAPIKITSTDVQAARARAGLPPQ